MNDEYYPPLAGDKQISSLLTPESSSTMRRAKNNCPLGSPGPPHHRASATLLSHLDKAAVVRTESQISKCSLLNYLNEM